MTFRTYDVKGDGHCYYRCLYRIAQKSIDVKNALCIKNIEDEDIAVNQIRQYISISLKYEEKTQNILQNLINIYKDVPKISKNYPILKKININDLFQNNSNKVQYLIENTNIYASSFEIEIISEKLSQESSDIKIIILTQNYNEKIIDLSDKWLRQLQPILKTITNNHVSILINENNIHYKYMKFENQIIIKKNELQNYIEKLMEESSEEESSEED
jgi:vacuolar-type H+-ATPase subunit F/Vma7/uncharacterized protein (UPF0335 family)